MTDDTQHTGTDAPKRRPNIRLTPDVLVNGNGGSGEGLLALVLRDLLGRDGKKVE